MGIQISLPMMAFLVFMTGFAGFVDSAAGGGGLISLPAYLFAGLPPHYTYATNKFSAACGTTFATASFFKNGAMNIKVGILAAIGSFACRCHPCRDPPDMPAVPPRPPVHWVPGFCLSYLNQGHCLPLTGWYYHVRNPCIVPFLMPVQSGPIIREEYIITYKKIQSAGNLSRRITAYTPHIIRLV